MILNTFDLIFVFVLGMAGSGKTTFVQRCIAHLHQRAKERDEDEDGSSISNSSKKKAGNAEAADEKDATGGKKTRKEQKAFPYVVNLDPAVTHMPYEANIDIRDTVHYKELMAQYGLGPNGGLLTAVNLFATKFDQVIQLCEKRARESASKGDAAAAAAKDETQKKELEEEEEEQEVECSPINYIIGDTPGQIEVFTWSASGQIFAESFASTFPTCIAFIMDTPKCMEPRTFMSNMLQACSVLYKYRLPMVLVYNKCDISRHDFALDWMKDFELYQQAISTDNSYAASLSRSLSLVLDDFYGNLPCVGVSSITGSGMETFFDTVDKIARKHLNAKA